MDFDVVGDLHNATDNELDNNAELGVNLRMLFQLSKKSP